MSLLNQLYGAIPGFQGEFTTQEAEVTWGKTDVNDSFLRSVIIDGTSRDSGNTPDTILRAGLLMEADGTSKKWSPWVEATGKLSGVLVFAIDTQLDTGAGVADADRFIGAILVGGQWRHDQLIIELNSGVPGVLTAEARTQIKAIPVWLDDEPFVA